MDYKAVEKYIESTLELTVNISHRLKKRRKTFCELINTCFIVVYGSIYHFYTENICSLIFASYYFLLSHCLRSPMTYNRYETGRLSRFYARSYPPCGVLWVCVRPCPFVRFISQCAEESPCPCSDVWGRIRYTISDKIS